MNLIDELKWRGMFFDMTPDLEARIEKGPLKVYIGYDPTAPSLTIGNLVTIMLLIQAQLHGHQPFVVLGGATGRVGDPSGKSAERNLIGLDELDKNIAEFRKSFEKLLDFNASENPARMVNNYDWYKDMDVLHFLRDIGKYITVPYMLAKDSVKSRLESGLSFTEFSYQLIQGYDFVHLNQEYDIELQMGGSDQWGNMTTGMEMIRRMHGRQAHVLTCPLLTRADGTKIGKSEGENVWLNPALTSPYKFYQYWLNLSDDEAEKCIKIFSLLDQETIHQIITAHKGEPHLRNLQKRLAEEVTVMVHSREEYKTALQASEILFGKATKASFDGMSDAQFLDLFEGVPQSELSKSDLEQGIGIIDLLSDRSGFLKSNGEARRALKENSISLNKDKVSDSKMVNGSDLINDKFLLLQRGKKNYFVVKAV